MTSIVLLPPFFDDRIIVEVKEKFRYNPVFHVSIGTRQSLVEVNANYDAIKLLFKKLGEGNVSLDAEFPLFTILDIFGLSDSKTEEMATALGNWFKNLFNRLQVLIVEDPKRGNFVIDCLTNFLKVSECTETKIGTNDETLGAPEDKTSSNELDGEIEEAQLPANESSVPEDESNADIAKEPETVEEMKPVVEAENVDKEVTPAVIAEEPGPVEVAGGQVDNQSAIAKYIEGIKVTKHYRNCAIGARERSLWIQCSKEGIPLRVCLHASKVPYPRHALALPDLEVKRGIPPQVATKDNEKCVTLSSGAYACYLELESPQEVKAIEEALAIAKSPSA